MNSLKQIKENSISLLKELIAIPSFSKQEDKSAEKIFNYLNQFSIPTHRKLNNIWTKNKNFNPNLPTILLNSHHDTVMPNESWQEDPFHPVIKDGKLIGLGSNDSGGSLVSLMAVFKYFYEREDLNFNLIYSATAEEENSGLNGIESILSELGEIFFAIVGEPTNNELAIAEKGLMVLDCSAKGKAGHAGRKEGENAIVNAIADIEWFHSYKFAKESALLGPVQMTVTIIKAGNQHNIIPDKCNFTVDIRSTDLYTNEEILEIVRKHIKSDVKPRSMRLKPSRIEQDHPIVQSALKINIPLIGSPTTSDQAVIPFRSVKIGPGRSERSHTADEFIYLDEIKDGIQKYIQLLEQLNIYMNNSLL